MQRSSSTTSCGSSTGTLKMPPPVGSKTYDPNGRFSFCRGYITWFEWFVNVDNQAISFDGEIFTISSVNFPNVVQYVQIRPTWWPWNSNHYTLDHLVLYYWYVINPSPTQHPNAGLVVRWLFDPVKGMGIQFQKESPNRHVPFVFEQAPPTYWAYPLPGQL